MLNTVTIQDKLRVIEWLYPGQIGNVMDTESMSWGELAELTHATQVERFGFCTCEDNEGNENPYADCEVTV